MGGHKQIGLFKIMHIYVRKEFPIAASNEVELHFHNFDNLLYAAAESDT